MLKKWRTKFDMVRKKRMPIKLHTKAISFSRIFQKVQKIGICSEKKKKSECQKMYENSGI